MKTETIPWLSILIPAYNYPKGIERILDFLYLSNNQGVECIIGDDSNSKNVELSVKSHDLFKYGRVKYVRSINATGAVDNWNNLIKIAKGEYQLLLHHDECPECETFLSQLKELIEKRNKPNIIFLRCTITTFMGRRLRYHMPYSIITSLLKFTPECLFLHNLIGSPSNVVVRSDSSIDFDNNLKWIVDVEWMFRHLIQPDVNWTVARSLSIMSIYNEETSITSTLKPNIKQLSDSENKYIQNKLGNLFIFNFTMPNKIPSLFLSYLEKILWIIFRIFIILLGVFFNRSKPSWLKN
jgi:glycosyltransferase involved in cell wall biosynthesis